MTFDQKAEQTLLNLKDLLGVTHTERPSIISPYTVGCEIEVKFKYLFPELFEKYFKDVNFYELEYSRQQEINNMVTIAEEPLRSLLDSIVKAGVPKGNDKYWEFSFNPVNDLTLLYNKIEVLQKANLIPAGEHSLHLTIAGVKDIPDMYYVLMILELLFVKKERIQNGFSKDRQRSAFWSKKGQGGIFKKNQYDLIDNEIGFEFRTLFLYEDTDIYVMFQVLNYFLVKIASGEKSEIIKLVKDKMLSYDLPHKNWQKPYEQPEIWDTYIDNYESLSVYTKQLINDFKIIKMTLK